jgi:hypothetical protein
MRKALLLVLVVALTGCATLPMSGPIRIGPDLAPATDSESFYYSPALPADGATQTEILAGFIAAGTAPQNDYAIAREYLEESIKSVWNPNQELLIQSSSPKVQVVSDEVATVEIEVLARIDSAGRYETLPAGSTRVLEYGFGLQNGQIRLISAPDVTVVIRPVFDVVFKSYSIFFLDQSKRNLVPELRWFPATPATGTKLVNALLAGPSSWLAPFVVSAVPTGTKLSIDAVAIASRVAQVDLSAEALASGNEDRPLMKAQLFATLSQLPNVDEVSISIERSTQDIANSELVALPLVARSVLALGPEGMESLTGSNLNASSAGLSFFENRSISLLAASSGAGSLAAATESGVYRTGLANPGTDVELVSSRTSLIGLEYDQQQFLWLVGAGSDMQAISATGELLAVSAPWLGRQQVSAFALSPEGARAAVLVKSANRTRVLVAGVIRDASGAPTALAEPLEIASELESPILISWYNPVTVAIVNQGTDPVSLTLATLGGTARSLPALNQATALVSAGAGSGPFLLTSSGELSVYLGSFWSSTRDSITALTVVK